MKLSPRFVLSLLVFVCLASGAASAALAGDEWRPIDPADLAAKVPTVDKDADLVKIDPAPFKAALDASNGQLIQAKAKLQPARIGYGTGVSYMNVQRNIIDPKTRKWWEGANYDGVWSRPARASGAG